MQYPKKKCRKERYFWDRLDEKTTFNSRRWREMSCTSYLLKNIYIVKLRYPVLLNKTRHKCSLGTESVRSVKKQFDIQRGPRIFILFAVVLWLQPLCEPPPSPLSQPCVSITLNSLLVFCSLCSWSKSCVCELERGEWSKRQQPKGVAHFQYIRLDKLVDTGQKNRKENSVQIYRPSFRENKPKTGSIKREGISLLKYQADPSCVT